MIFLMIAVAGAAYARHLGVLSGLGKPNKKAPVVRGPCLPWRWSRDPLAVLSRLPGGRARAVFPLPEKTHTPVLGVGWADWRWGAVRF